MEAGKIYRVRRDGEKNWGGIVSPLHWRMVKDPWLGYEDKNLVGKVVEGDYVIWLDFTPIWRRVPSYAPFGLKETVEVIFYKIMVGEMVGWVEFSNNKGIDFEGPVVSCPEGERDDHEALQGS